MICLTGLLTFSALANEPTITDVVVRQRWPWSQQVDIQYLLTCDPLLNVDVALTVKNGTDTLVLRRVLAAPASGIDKEMYVGVFEVTQGQWSNVMGSAVSAYFTHATDRALRPMEYARYNEMRGASPNYNWPATGSAVNPSSFLGKMWSAGNPASRVIRNGFRVFCVLP